MKTDKLLMEYYQSMLDHAGPQHWWPGESPFEIIVGAILTQNTNWKNVEAAITQLKEHQLMDPKVMFQCDTSTLAEAIRPAGYYHVKAKRLKHFLGFLFNDYQGSIHDMLQTSTEVLRKELLAVNGIGPETADSILLYAGEHPIFVVDQYTWRIFHRHGLLPEQADYHSIQQWLMDNLAQDAQLYNEYHALIVHTGKNFCRSKPLCESCPLKDLLPSDGIN